MSWFENPELADMPYSPPQLAAAGAGASPAFHAHALFAPLASAGAGSDVVTRPKGTRDGLADFHAMQSADRHSIALSEETRKFMTAMMRGVKEETTTAYERVARNYQRIMIALNLNARVVNLSQFMLYAFVQLTRRKPPICGQTVRQHMTALRSVAPFLESPPLVLENDFPEFTTRFLASIVKVFPPGTVPRLAFGLTKLTAVRPYMLDDVAKQLEIISTTPSGSLEHAAATARVDAVDYTWRVMNFYHQGLLRNEEGRNIRRRNLFPYEEKVKGRRTRGFRIVLEHTKTGGPFNIFILERDDDRDVYAWLRAIYDAGGDPDAAVLDMSVMGFGQAQADGAITVVMRSWLALTGEKDLLAYSCHSLRHGGASDMLDSGIAPDVVATQGRWRSLVWFTTYRHITSLSARVFLKLGKDSDGLDLLE